MFTNRSNRFTAPRRWLLLGLALLLSLGLPLGAVAATSVTLTAVGGGGDSASCLTDRFLPTLIVIQVYSPPGAKCASRLNLIFPPFRQIRPSIPLN